MRNIVGHAVIAAALAVAILPAANAFAHETTPLEKAELAELRPQLRSQVEARLTGEHTVRGILETMLLNSISALFAANRVVAVDFDRGVAVVEGKNREIKAFASDVTTLAIKS